MKLGKPQTLGSLKGIDKGAGGVRDHAQVKDQAPAQPSLRSDLRYAGEDRPSQASDLRSAGEKRL